MNGQRLSLSGAALAALAFLPLAAAQRIGMPPLTGGDDALNLAVPTAVARSLESVDGVAAPAPLALASYLARRAEGQERLARDFGLDWTVSGQLAGAAGNYTLNLRLTRGAATQDLSVKGADFAALVKAANAALVPALGLKPTAEDARELAAVEGGLPNPLVAAVAASAGNEGVDLAPLAAAGDNPWALSVRGLVLAQTGKAAEGLALVQKAAGLAPLDIHVQTVLGTVTLATGRNAEARGIIERTLRMNPFKPELHYLLGAALFRLSRPLTAEGLRAAAAEYARALEGNPAFLEAGLDLADALVRLNDPQRATDVLTDLVPRMPDEVGLHDRLLTLFLSPPVSDAGLAASYLADVAAKYPAVPDAVYALAVRLPDAEAALGLVTLGDARYPQSAPLAMARGELLERRGQYPEAVRAYTAAVERDPTLAVAGFALAASLSKVGQFEAAEAALVRAQDGKTEPKTTARMYLQTGRLERAAPLLAALVGGAGARDVEVHFLQGLLLTRQGRFDDAKKALDTALGLSPNYEPAKTGLLSLDDARRLGQPQLTGPAAVAYGIGLGSLDAADPLEAASAFRAALAAAPDNPHAAFYLGVALFEAGDAEGAATALEVARAGLADNVVVLTNLGGAYLQVGRFDLALERLERATGLDARYARGWFYLGLTSMQLGRGAAAREQILRAVGLDTNLRSQAQPYLDALGAAR